ncbi:MAG: restriction endonuclease subunit S [Ignavibacteria bacterium]|nr:restriction endonuclease subunit S [Ignavibacteria bacterium]
MSRKQCFLGDVIKFDNGKTRPNSDGDHPIYGGNGILGYTAETNYYSETIIIGRVGAYCGSVYYENKPIWVSDNALAAKPKEFNNAKYLYYFLINLQLNLFAEGSSHPLVTQTLLNSIDIEISDDENEQKAIAGVLSSLDDKIDLLHRQNKALEAMAETLFRQWFVEEKDESWEVIKLKEFINVKHGYAFKGEHISNSEHDQILVTPGNFKIGGGFKIEKIKYYHDKDYPKSFILKKGDLIVTMTDLSKEGDTLGYSALVPEFDDKIFLHNQRIGKVLIKDNMSKFFLYYLMKTDEYQWYIHGSASGTSIRHTSPTSICNYEFSLPPQEKINDFEIYSGNLYEKITYNQNQIRTLEKLRDTLLPKLMSGEVRVKL